MRRHLDLLVVAVAFAIACGATSQNPSTPAPQAPASAPASQAASLTPAPTPPASAAPISAPPIEASPVLASQALGGGVDAGEIDHAVDPCEDFYQFACGAWMKRTAIPADKPRIDAFTQIDDGNQETLRSILEADASGKADAADPYAKKAGDLFAACMDEAGIEKAGIAPLTRELAEIAGVKDVPTLAHVVADYQAHGIRVPFELYPEQDEKDATQMIGAVDQGGLGLPDRDYYLVQDAAHQKILDAYRQHVTRMLALAGETAAQAAADTKAILDLETQLARVSMTKVEQRDPVKTYNRVNLAGLQSMAPTFPWAEVLTGVGLGPDSGIAGALDVKSPQFFKGLDAVLRGTAPAVWQAYLRYHVTAAMAPTLPKRFVDEDFHFQQVLTGVKAQKPRWKRCTAAINHLMGMAPARTFVEQKFSPTERDRGVAMVRMVEQAMGQDIVGLSWMDDATKTQALAKLALVANQIGYPDHWRNYDALDIDRHSYATSALAAQAFEVRRLVAKIGKPVDRSDWDMTPPTVNAYYDPSLNTMVFPAGILQPPFFGRAASLAMNFGGIGMVMGHELTHGFDDEGRQFDGHGDLTDWWTKSSADAYKERAQCIARQYGGYVVDGVHLNGDLTLGENIADNGGIKLSYAAFEALHRAQGAGGTPASASAKGGTYTPEQQFFLAYAQSWCERLRPEYAHLMVTVDPHSPAEFRVNGPLSNMPEFQQAFTCKPGTAMAPTNRCQVW